MSWIPFDEERYVRIVQHFARSRREADSHTLVRRCITNDPVLDVVLWAKARARLCVENPT